MYKFQAILGLISKALSNIVLVICLPVSLIVFIGSICLWQIEQLINTIYGADTAQNIIDTMNSGTDLVKILTYVGLGLFIFILCIYVIFIIAIVIKISLYKSISGFVVARSKELRNIELNKAQEKLDKYRYYE